MHQKQVKYAFGCRLTFDSDVVARDGIDIKRLARFQQPGHAVTGNSMDHVLCLTLPQPLANEKP